MKLSEITSEDLIFPDLQATSVSGILREFAHRVCAAGKFNDEETLYERLMQRESQETTGIANGVAIPHCKVENLHTLMLAIGYAPTTGVDFKAMDGERTYFFFLIISPSNEAVQNLRALAAVSRLFKSATFMAELQKRPGKTELLNLIRDEENSVVK